jgi:hypothetical protein
VLKICIYPGNRALFEKLIITQLSKTFFTFIDPEVSLPCTQNLSIRLQMRLVSILTPYFFDIHFNIIFAYAPTAPKLSLPFRYSTKCWNIFLRFFMPVTCSAHLIPYHPNHILWRLQVMKLLIMIFPSHPPVISSLLEPYLLAPCSRLQIIFPLLDERLSTSM